MRMAATLLALLLIACGGSNMNGGEEPHVAPLSVTSPDLTGGSVPREFTCDGGNRIPRLSWSSLPTGSQELAVEVLDPDAPGGTFTHWLAYAIPAAASGLGPPLPAGVLEGMNDFGRRGYGGPCPPRGPAHHYHFIVLALDTRLGLQAAIGRSELESRVKGHVIGKGELVATYQRA
jgi:Raf kinase inhibitor-like YbhB/YbcL family protein